ncbi:MAG: hypothetical protein ACLFN9_02905 [Desulfococcaceae bacterium]
MSKRGEERILAEIRRRVLAKDATLQNRLETDQTRAATREALADMTALSREEVDQIADEVRKEAKKRQSRRRVLGALVFLALAGVLGSWLTDRLNPPPDVSLEEPFDSDANGWIVGDEFTHRFTIADGAYRLESRRDNWCFWDDISLTLPEPAVVEVDAVWERGKFEQFGLMLMEPGENQLVFQLRGDGAASFGRKAADQWITNIGWSEGFSPESGNAHRLRVEIGDGQWKYFANGKLFREGALDGFETQELGLRICGEQIVSFTGLRVVDPGRAQPVLEEGFSDAGAGWSPQSDIKRRQRLQNGAYVYTTYQEDVCHWTAIRTPLEGDFEAELVSAWRSGETANYGFQLVESTERFLAFALRNDGKAQFARFENDEFTVISPLRPAGRPGDGTVENRQTVQVRDGRFEYFVNDKSLGGGRADDMNFRMIGVRVCGRQTVAFEHLSVRPLP